MTIDEKIILKGDILKNLGNIPQNYDHRARLTECNRLIIEPKLILKLYSMMKSGVDEKLNKRMLNQAESFVVGELQIGELDPHLGLGFAILSEDMLSVARWSKHYPTVIQNDIYAFEGYNLDTAVQKSLAEVGSFCVWELDVVHFEQKAWKEYLISQHTEADKRKYLEERYCSY